MQQTTSADEIVKSIFLQEFQGKFIVVFLEQLVLLA